MLLTPLEKRVYGRNLARNMPRRTLSDCSPVLLSKRRMDKNWSILNT